MPGAPGLGPEAVEACRDQQCRDDGGDWASAAEVDRECEGDDQRSGQVHGQRGVAVFVAGEVGHGEQSDEEAHETETA